HQARPSRNRRSRRRYSHRARRSPSRSVWPPEMSFLPRMRIACGVQFSSAGVEVELALTSGGATRAICRGAEATPLAARAALFSWGGLARARGKRGEGCAPAAEENRVGQQRDDGEGQRREVMIGGKGPA